MRVYTGRTCTRGLQGDAMKRQHEGTGGPEVPRSSLLDRLNRIAMRVYGPGDRAPQDAAGAPISPAAEQWYREVCEHFQIERDEHGNEYLFHRDDSAEQPRTGSERN
ncbi:hypothetical protein AUQ48_12700 [Kocuria flava]|uniref:Uncharacterized protein n=2 Tax=Kocuria flava TaxID=446860 RepID=A0A2N4T3W3_9MICC|nr:hypothetical protein AUQ48_12700 [Kocuria flava]